MITVASPALSPVLFPTLPAHHGVVSWNGSSHPTALAVRAQFGDSTWSEWLPYASVSETERTSHSARDARLRIDVDVLAASAPFRAIEVRFTGELDAVALATPEHARHPLTSDSGSAIELAVAERSQYASDDPEQRGWCSPTSLAMLLAFHGVEELPLAALAERVYDLAYAGTGNWTFNVAHAGSVGLRAFVVYVRDFAHARTFLEAGLPLAISYRWSGAELPGAPLEHSDGHIAVLRGFDEDGNPILNDPAHPAVRVVYARSALESIWLRGGGVAYALAPRERTSDLIALANA